MIINNPGAEFTYEGTTYTVGVPIIGTVESEYEGLYGSITEIRDGDDKETENETPDIYCAFEPPVMPDEIKGLEKTFSDLYNQPKTLDDITLDMVIMAPEMILQLDNLSDVRKKVPIFILMEDWAVDGEHGNACELFTDYEDARLIMIEKLREELDNGCIPRWEDKEEFVVDSTKDSYEGYLDGGYLEDHYAISILQQPLTMSTRHIREVGERYLAQCHAEGSQDMLPEVPKEEPK